MGIRKQDFYICQCDFCGTKLENGEGGVLCLKRKDSAKEHLKLAEWKMKNGKFACENCWEKL